MNTVKYFGFTPWILLPDVKFQINRLSILWLSYTKLDYEMVTIKKKNHLKLDFEYV